MGPDRWALGDSIREAAPDQPGFIDRTKNWAINKLGGIDKAAANRRAQGIGNLKYRSGVKQGSLTGNVDKVSDADLAKEAAGRTAKKIGKVTSDIGAGVGDATSKAMKGVRQGLEDNPAGIAGAAAGALAAGWGLSKLRRKKAPV